MLFPFWSAAKLPPVYRVHIATGPAFALHPNQAISPVQLPTHKQKQDMPSKVFLTLAIVLVLTHGHVPSLMGQETPPDPTSAGTLDATVPPAQAGLGTAPSFTEGKGFFASPRPLIRPPSPSPCTASARAC